MKKAEWQAVGRVQRAEGREGELKVRFYPGVSLGTVRSIRLERRGGAETLGVESFRPGKNSCILKVWGIDSQAQAEALAGGDLLVPGESLQPPEKGSYYPAQLIGCRVLTRDGTDLGEVRTVVPVGESGLLVIGQEPEEVLIPLAREICYEIDPEAGWIRVDPPPGLLDLNEI